MQQTRRHWFVAGLLALSAVAFGCGSAAPVAVVDVGSTPHDRWLTQGDPVPNIMVLPTNGVYEPDVLVECGGPPTFPAAALRAPVLLSESDVADGAMVPLEEFLASGEGGFWPQDGYWTFVNTDDVLMIVHIGADGAATTLATERTDSDWMATRLATGGSCPIQVPLPEGLGEVGWREDPATPNEPESTLIALLATGKDCSSGHPMGDRLAPPQVVVTDDAIYVALVQYRPTGTQACPGNPEEAVTINISEPRGDRPVINARTAAGTLADYVPVSPS